MKCSLNIFCAIFVNVSLCHAQATQKVNAASLELGKTGLIYNLTFDHKSPKKNFGFRLGVGSNLAKYLNAVSFGGGGYYLVGKTNNFLEFGVDLQYLIVDEVSDDQRGLIFILTTLLKRSIQVLI
jgi:hypothetical protein